MSSIRSTRIKEMVSRSQIQRVCRMYYTDADAARALGISQPTLRRLCEKYGIKSPTQQRKSA